MTSARRCKVSSYPTLQLLRRGFWGCIKVVDGIIGDSSDMLPDTANNESNPEALKTGCCLGLLNRSPKVHHIQ